MLPSVLQMWHTQPGTAERFDHHQQPLYVSLAMPDRCEPGTVCGPLWAVLCHCLCGGHWVVFMPWCS